MSDLPVNGLHHGMGLSADRDRTGEVRVAERLERSKEAVPSFIPKFHQRFTRGRGGPETPFSPPLRLFPPPGPEGPPPPAPFSAPLVPVGNPKNTPPHPPPPSNLLSPLLLFK